METLVIIVPDDKSTEVKEFLKKIGVFVQNKAKVRQLANEINAMVKPGPKPGIDEIVAEVREVRAGR